jgi:site-specific DNA-methyltransferase (adenine-specific)
VFGTGVNLAIGNALELKKLPRNWKGIWLYVEKAGIWVDITATVKSEVQVSLGADIGMFPYEEAEEKSFVTMVEGLEEWLNRKAKESKMETEADIAKLISLPAGWAVVKDWVRDVATKVEENWQGVQTPEWVAKEMVQCIPELKNKSRFLVLFNIELLDALVKEGVPVNKITFGSDSALEEAMAVGKYKRLKTIPIGKSFDEMKTALKDHAGQYEVVLSNPPYQIMDEGFGASAKPIYHEIVMYVIDQLKPQYVCMITPSRWMAGGKGLNDYRAKMLADRHIRLIQDFPGEKEVFDSVMIKGGVSFFLWDSSHKGDCEFIDGSGVNVSRNIGEFNILVRDNISIQVLRKILAKHTGKPFCDSKVFPQKPFGLRTFFKDWVPSGTPGAVKVYSVNRKIEYAMANDITDTHGILGKYKVCIARARSQGITDAEGLGKPSLVTGYIFQIGKSEACTETYLVAGAFNTKKETDNYEKYLRTKFYRFCLRLRLISQDINREKFAWVPDLGNYANPVTDEELYEHFGLTQKEQEHINSTIKEIV